MENNIVKRDFQELIKTVKDGFRQQDKKTDSKIEGLAMMIKKGFDGVDKEFEGNKKEHQRIFDRLDKIDTKLSGKVALAIRTLLRKNLDFSLCSELK